MTIRSRKPYTRQQQNSYSQLESRQLLAADFSTDLITSAEIFTVEPTIDFVEVQWGEESRLAKSGQWLIWQNDEGAQAQTQDLLKVGDQADIASSTLTTFSDQKLTVTDEISSGLFVIEGADHWSYELVAESVSKWLPNAIVEPNFIVNVNAIPNDADFGELWGLNNTGQSGGVFDADIDAVEAWDITTGSSDVLVAVIDTGVDYTHPDLVDNIWVNPGEIAGDGIDNDGNGYIDDIHGWDFANNDNDPMDDDNHGTHVAGTIGAVGNNGLGVTGVSQDVSIVAVKFLGANGGTTADAIRSIEYTNTLKQQGHNLVLTNNSWGGGGFSSALEGVIEDAMNLDILFVAAAGNDGSSSLSYPAGYDLDNIISVAATDRNDQIASFSNFNETWVDLAAPGVDILSTIPGGGYASFDGTSMASPHVAGALALLAAVEPNLSALELRDQLFERVDELPQLDGVVGTSGRLNAFSLVDPAFISDSTVDFDADSYLTPGTIEIDLTDAGGFAAGATLVIESSSGDTETVAVTPVGGLNFSTSIQSVAGVANAQDGTLQVASGDTLTASYFDNDNGVGIPVTISDSASIFVDDHGNDAASATPLDLAFNLTGRIETSSDQDWFSFETIAGLEYEFEILGGSLANTTLSLYDTDGTTLLDFDDASFGSQILWTAPSAGTYFVSVGHSGDDNGTYQFSGAAIIPRGTVTFDAATYRLPGGTLGVDLTDPTGFVAGATVMIESSSGDVETFAITATGAMEFSTSVSLVEGPANVEDGILQVTSRDTLTATYFDSDDGFGGSFTAVDTAVVIADDHGNDAPSATPVTFPIDLVADLEESGDQDWFSFEAIAGFNYEFETTLQTLPDSTLTLYDTDGTSQLIFNDDGGNGLASLIGWQAQESGTYYLEVRAFGSSQTGLYQLLGNFSAPEATVTFDSETYQPPGTVGLVVADPNGFASDAVVTIETLSGDVETLAITAGGAFEFSTSISLIEGEGAPTPNDGTLNVTPGDSFTATYFDSDDEFRGTFTATDTARIISDDHGGDASTATPVDFPFDVAGELEVSGDNDWFSFEVLAGFDYEFETTLNSLGDSVITLLDTDGVTQIASNDDGGAGLASLLQWQPTESGTYFLLVRAFGNSGTGTYQLAGSSNAPSEPESTVTFDSAIFEPEETIQFSLTDATGFLPGATVTIETLLGDRETLVISATGEMEFTASIDSVLGAANINDGILQVIPGSTITATYIDDDNGTGGSFTATDTATILFDDHGDDAGSATAVGVPFNLEGNINLVGDVDWFSFEGVEGTQYDFEAIATGLTSNTLQLFDADGETTLDVSSGTSAPITWIAPSNGTFYLSVDGGSGSGTYILTGTTSTPEATITLDANNYGFGETIGIEVTDPNGFVSGAVVVVQTSIGDFEILNITANGALEYSTSIGSALGLPAPGDGVLQVGGGTITATYFDSDDGFGGNLTVTDSATTFADDHGNDPQSATLVDVSFDTTGNINFSGDEDWFGFEAAAGQQYDFGVSGITSAIFLNVYDNDGSLLINTGGLGGNLSHTWLAPSSGTYFVSVAFAGNETGAYQFTGSTDAFLLGDTNQDGSVNFLDISPFISLVETSTYQPEADMNGDGSVNFLDISPFIDELSA